MFNTRQFPVTRYLWLMDLLLFKLCWVVLVVFKTQGVFPVLAMMLLKLILWPEFYKSLGLIVTSFLIGLTMDIILKLSGFFAFPSGGFPVWMIFLWAVFAMSLPRGFAFVGQLQPGSQALFGMLAGCVGYSAGYWLQAVNFGYPYSISILVVSLLWAVFIPLVFWLVKLPVTANESV